MEKYNESMILHYPVEIKYLVETNGYVSVIIPEFDIYFSVPPEKSDEITQRAMILIKEQISILREI